MSEAGKIKISQSSSKTATGRHRPCAHSKRCRVIVNRSKLGTATALHFSKLPRDCVGWPSVDSLERRKTLFAMVRGCLTVVAKQRHRHAKVLLPEKVSEGSTTEGD